MTKDAIVTSKILFSSFEEEMRTYAINNHVPIISDAGLDYLVTVLKGRKVSNILELGTAIGYSASIMSRVSGAMVTTIERDEGMVEIASKNILKQGLENKIRIIYKDALEAFDDVKDRTYDLIFIDAAKGQYKKFFSMYQKLLAPNGVIVCDNLNFHGMVAVNQETLSRGVRGLVRKLRSFKVFLESNISFKTKFSDIGDGMSISSRNHLDLFYLEDAYTSIFCKKEQFAFYDVISDDKQKDKWYHNYIDCQMELTDETYQNLKIIAEKNENTLRIKISHYDADKLNIKPASVDYNIMMAAKPEDILIPNGNMVEIVKLTKNNASLFEEFFYLDNKHFGEEYSLRNAKRLVDVALKDQIQYFGISLENKIVGAIHTFSCNKMAKMENFSILESYRGNHYGARLFKYVTDLLSSQGFELIELIADGNDTYKDLYAKWGFKFISGHYFIMF